MLAHHPKLLEESDPANNIRIDRAMIRSVTFDPMQEQVCRTVTAH